MFVCVYVFVCVCVCVCVCVSASVFLNVVIEQHLLLFVILVFEQICIMLKRTYSTFRKHVSVRVFVCCVICVHRNRQRNANTCHLVGGNVCVCVCVLGKCAHVCVYVRTCVCVCGGVCVCVCVIATVPYKVWWLTMVMAMVMVMVMVPYKVWWLMKACVSPVVVMEMVSNGGGACDGDGGDG